MRVASGQSEQVRSMPASFSFSDDDSVVLVDGRTVALSMLMVKNCSTNDAFNPSCLWTDSKDIPVHPLQSQIRWDGPGPALPPGQASWKAGFPSAADVSAAIAHAANVDLVDDESAGCTPSGSNRLDCHRELPVESLLLLDIPVFVLIQPDRANQTRRMEAMIRAAGIWGVVSFVPIKDQNEVGLHYLEVMDKSDQDAEERLMLSSRIEETRQAR